MKNWIHNFLLWFLKTPPKQVTTVMVSQTPTLTEHEQFKELVDELSTMDFYNLFSLYLEFSIKPCMPDIKSYRQWLESLVWHLNQKVEIDRKLLLSAEIKTMKPVTFLTDRDGMILADLEFEVRQFLECAVLLSETLWRIDNEEVTDISDQTAGINDYNLMVTRPVIINLQNLFNDLLKILKV